MYSVRNDNYVYRPILIVSWSVDYDVVILPVRLMHWTGFQLVMAGLNNPLHNRSHLLLLSDRPLRSSLLYTNVKPCHLFSRHIISGSYWIRCLKPLVKVCLFTPQDKESCENYKCILTASIFSSNRLYRFVYRSIMT